MRMEQSYSDLITAAQQVLGFLDRLRDYRFPPDLEAVQIAAEAYRALLARCLVVVEGQRAEAGDDPHPRFVRLPLRHGPDRASHLEGVPIWKSAVSSR